MSGMAGGGGFAVIAMACGTMGNDTVMMGGGGFVLGGVFRGSGAWRGHRLGEGRQREAAGREGQWK
jgi:hypothetical protein